MNKASLNKYGLAMLIGSMAFLFQNCASEVRFGTPELKLNSKAGSDAVLVGAEPVDPNLDDSNTSGQPSDTTNTSDNSTTVVTDSTATPSTPIDDGGKGDHGNKPPQGHDGLNFVCVLKGPGKSQLLHLQGTVFSSNVSTVKAVCTTQAACEENVSQAFEVHEAKFKGACQNNPNVVRLTGDEIISLLSK